MGRNGGPKTGGRKAGTPNKKTQELIDILDAHGYSPEAELVEAAALAKKEYKRWEIIFDAIQEKRASLDLVPLSETKSHEYLKIMQASALGFLPYLRPKRKAIEVSGPEGKDIFQAFTDLMRELAAK